MWGEGIPGGKDGVINGVEGMRAHRAPLVTETYSEGLEYRVHSLENLPNSTPTDFITRG